jgi:hypothetical protein
MKIYVNLGYCIAIYVTPTPFTRCVQKVGQSVTFCNMVSHLITKDVVMELGYIERAVCFSIPSDTTQISKVTGFGLLTDHHKTYEYIQERVK